LDPRAEEDIVIRTLIMIAVAGFVLSVGSLSAAVAIGGPDAIARGGWGLFGHDWGDWHREGDRKWDRDWDRDWSREWGRDGDGAESDGARGPQATRTLDWSGADSLEIDLAADVRYIQTAGPGRVEVTGPARAIDDVEIRGDSIRYDRRRHWPHPKLSIVIRAPDIRAFDVTGNNTLRIEGYRQQSLRLDLSGDAEVVAEGEAGEVELDLSGSSEADLADLRTRGADADVSGAARTTLAPTEWARLDISGAGDVRLTTNPARVETDISGAGRVRRGDDGPTVSPSPSPSPSPPPKGEKL
jgi:hypothetical protein